VSVRTTGASCGCAAIIWSIPWPAIPASGWEKGQVENLGLVRERFFSPRLRIKNYDELNAWLLDQCVTYAKAHGHPELGDQTIWQMFEAERPSLVAYAGHFDGFHAVPASVSKTCLVQRLLIALTRWRMEEIITNLEIKTDRVPDKALTLIDPRHLPRLDQDNARTHHAGGWHGPCPVARGRRPVLLPGAWTPYEVSPRGGLGHPSVPA
jgi:hypothetical protein